MLLMMLTIPQKFSRKFITKKLKLRYIILINTQELNRSDTQKYKIDTYNLIKQFEKMFNREMTEEEKSIIKLAYIMGKTNQFQIKIVSDPIIKK